MVGQAKDVLMVEQVRPPYVRRHTQGHHKVEEPSETRSGNQREARKSCCKYCGFWGVFPRRQPSADDSIICSFEDSTFRRARSMHFILSLELYRSNIVPKLRPIPTPASHHQRSDLKCLKPRTEYHQRTPAARSTSSTPIPGPPGTASCHTFSGTRLDSSNIPQFGLCSACSHLKSSTCCH